MPSSNPFQLRAQQRDAQRLLWQALEKKDAQKAWDALRSGAKLRGFDPHGVPALQRALGLPLGDGNDNGLTLLQRALADGASLEDVPREGAEGFAFTPLLMAAWLGSLEQVDWLLQRGASIKALTGQDVGLGLGQRLRWHRSTAVHLAVQRPDTDLAVLQRLLTAGGRVDRYDGNGHLPLHTALVSGRRARGNTCTTTAVTVLLQAGADPNAPVRGARRAATLVGDRPLHLAADHGRVEDARVLLDAGADLEVLDAQGRTPLHRAQQASSVDPVLVALLEQGVLSRAVVSTVGPSRAPQRPRL